jgi:hypothetical protein
VAADWSPDKLHFYGRAELKQSDHRPILAVIDIEVHKLDEKRRGEVFEEELKNVGPPDGTVVLQVRGRRLHMRFCVGIAVRFCVRFPAQGGLQFNFQPIYLEMC